MTQVNGSRSFFYYHRSRNYCHDNSKDFHGRYNLSCDKCTNVLREPHKKKKSLGPPKKFDFPRNG